jgi:hypothetical protein
MPLKQKSVNLFLRDASVSCCLLRYLLLQGALGMRETLHLPENLLLNLRRLILDVLMDQGIDLPLIITAVRRSDTQDIHLSPLA